MAKDIMAPGGIPPAEGATTAEPATSVIIAFPFESLTALLA